MAPYSAWDHVESKFDAGILEGMRLPTDDARMPFPHGQGSDPGTVNYPLSPFGTTYDATDRNFQDAVSAFVSKEDPCDGIISLDAALGWRNDGDLSQGPFDVAPPNIKVVLSGAKHHIDISLSAFSALDVFASLGRSNTGARGGSHSTDCHNGSQPPVGSSVGLEHSSRSTNLKCRTAVGPFLTPATKRRKVSAGSAGSTPRPSPSESVQAGSTPRPSPSESVQAGSTPRPSPSESASSPGPPAQHSILSPLRNNSLKHISRTGPSPKNLFTELKTAPSPTTSVDGSHDPFYQSKPFVTPSVPYPGDGGPYDPNSSAVSVSPDYGSAWCLPALTDVFDAPSLTSGPVRTNVLWHPPPPPSSGSGP